MNNKDKKKTVKNIETCMKHLIIDYLIKKMIGPDSE